MSRFIQLICPILMILFLTNCHALKVRKLSSIEHVEALKKGALLVRLKTSKSKIDKLVELGRNNEAEKVRQERIEDNKNIITAFKNHFEYCPVYFFKSGNSNEVRTNNLNHIFLNENLEIDTTIQYSGEFLTAEFSRTQGTPTIDEEGNQVATGSSYGIPALVVMDKNFVQLSKPFPAVVQTSKYKEAFVKNMAVQLLDQNINYFFFEGRRWKAKKMLVDF